MKPIFTKALPFNAPFPIKRLSTAWNVVKSLLITAAAPFVEIVRVTRETGTLVNFAGAEEAQDIVVFANLIGQLVSQVKGEAFVPIPDVEAPPADDPNSQEDPAASGKKTKAKPKS